MWWPCLKQADVVEGRRYVTRCEKGVVDIESPVISTYKAQH